MIPEIGTIIIGGVTIAVVISIISGIIDGVKSCIVGGHKDILLFSVGGTLFYALWFYDKIYGEDKWSCMEILGYVVIVLIILWGVVPSHKNGKGK